MLERGLTISNGKGGVGKSSLVANISGCLAAAGHRVLAVDLDPQSNLGMDFGVGPDGEGTDMGESLKEAVMTGGKVPVSVTENIRTGVDLVAAGRAHTAELADWLTLIKDRDNGPRAFAGLGLALAGIADSYDMILFDTPPASNSPLARLALTASHWVIAPAKRDSASMNGLAQVAALYAEVVRQNPLLEFAGAVMFCFDPRETGEIREARARLAEEVLGGRYRVFDTIIPAAEKAARSRDFGWLASEYEGEAAKDKRRRLASLRERRRTGGPVRSANLASETSAARVAEAYRSLTDEIVAALFPVPGEATA